MTHDITEANTNNAIADLNKAIRSEIGPFAAPDVMFRVSALPKTRSGKIMRRLLRKIVHGERHMARLGDLSTLSEPESVHHIIERVEARFKELQQRQQ
jgi:acetyl-CoA synthetase